MTPTICHCPGCDGETRVESECVAPMYDKIHRDAGGVRPARTAARKNHCENCQRLVVERDAALTKVAELRGLLVACVPVVQLHHLRAGTQRDLLDRIAAELKEGYGK